MSTTPTRSKCFMTPFSYDFRDATLKRQLESELESVSKTPKKRKTLDKNETPSFERSPEHDCNQVNPDATLQKVDARITSLLQRLAISYALNCKTTRGRTQFNGGQAHCGGCEAAHAALTPTLYDDKLNRVVREIEEKEFSHINEISQLYFRHRFALDPTSIELKNLDDPNSNIRTEQLKKIVSILKHREKKGSFVNSDFEKMRNSTFINSTDCNRFDSHIESLLKLLEDQLCKDCTAGTKTPSAALAEICKEYDRHLITALTNLEEALTRFTNLQTCWTTLIDSEKKLLATEQDAPEYETCCDDLLEAIKDYKTAFDQQFDKKPGVPSLENFQAFLKNFQSPFVLKHILGKHSKGGVEAAIEFYKANRIHLKQPPKEETETEFNEAQIKIIIRREEAQTQLNALGQISENTEEIIKRIFGVKNDRGEVITPTKNQIAEQLIKSMVRIIPADLSKTTRKPRKKLTFSEVKTT